MTTPRPDPAPLFVCSGDPIAQWMADELAALAKADSARFKRTVARLLTVKPRKFHRQQAPREQIGYAE